MTGIAIGAACVAGLAFGFPAVYATALITIALRIGGKVATVWVLAVTAVAIGGALRAVAAPETTSPPWSDDAEAFRGVVLSGPMSTERGQRFSVTVDQVRLGPAWQEVDAVICVFAAEPPILHRGDRVSQLVTVERLADLPEGVSQAFIARGCSATATAWRTTLVEHESGWRHRLDSLRREMSGRLQATAPGDAGALMAGLVTGDDGALSDTARDAFLTTGTTHITAVSGSNIAIVLVATVAIGGWFGLHRRILWQSATAGGIWCYALLVGLEPPALRAALVATGAVFAVTFGRRPDLVTLTMLAAAVQLLYRPSDYWTLSFRLSFVSALALALVLRETSAGGVGGYLRTGLIATAAAQIATTPVLISTFGRVSPLSLPTNLLIAPFVAVAFPLALVAGLLGFVSVSLGEAAAAPGALSATIVIRIVEAMTGAAGSQLTVGRPGALVNLGVVGVSAATIALLSVDGRRAIGRVYRWEQSSQRPPLRWMVLAGGGFAIGLILGTIR